MVYFTKIAGTRLGNWMFQYATAASLSIDGKVGCYLENGDADDPITKHPFFANVKFVTTKPKCSEYIEKGFRYNKIPVPDNSDLLIRGFFQSPKYFEREKVLSIFRCDEQMRKLLFDKYKDPFSNLDLTSISVRRGDYLLYPHQFPFVGKRYLKNAIEALYDVKHFIICSDDLPWCRKFFTEKRFPGKIFYFSKGDDLTDDIYIPSLCKNNILANSSFSWWGGYLNENPSKNTIAPSRWFGFDCVKKGFDWSDIYYGNTDILDNEYSTLEYVNAWLKGILGLEIMRKKIISPIYQSLRKYGILR